jgi:hypothetical protein
VALLFAVFAAAIVFVIAAVVLGREARRLGTDNPRPVFDVDEAVAWVADRLPEAVTSRLTYDDLRMILTWSLEQLPTGGQDAMVADDETVGHVTARAAAVGRSWLEADVWAVVDQETRYLESIGAIGFPPPERGGGPADR